MRDIIITSCEKISSSSSVSSQSIEVSSDENVLEKSIRKRKLSTINQQQQVQASSSSSSFTSVQISLIAGSCAGIASTIGVYPMDVLRTRMQQQQNHGPLHIFRSTIQHGGIRALYTGIIMPLLAQTVYKGTVFTVSNITQQYLVTCRITDNNNHGIILENIKPTLFDQFLGGLIGGGFNAAFFVTPVEFIRNQLIAQNTTGSKVSNNNLPKMTTFDVIKNSIGQTNGLLLLWRGASWTIYRDSLGCGCFFYTMAYCQQIMQKNTIIPNNDGQVLTTTTTTTTVAPSITSTIISGGIAGLAYWLVALPFDTIKTWVQSSDVTIKQISVLETIQTIYNKENNNSIREVVQRLFRGWQFAYFRGIPSAAITMTTYSYIYRYLSNGYDTFTS